MDTRSRLRNLIPATTAGLLAFTLFATPACSGQNPAGPDTTSTDAASPAVPPDAGTLGDGMPDPASLVTFASAEWMPDASGHIEALASTSSRSYTSPVSSGCVRLFYDPSFYNWLAFQNVCSQAIFIDYIGYYPGYGGSAVTLRPGQKSSTGYSYSEVQKKRGYQLFICPAGFIPVDAKNNYVSRVNTPFKCLKQ